MDYLLDRYIYAFLPFTITDDWKQSINFLGISIVRIADWFCKTQDIWEFYSSHTNFLCAEILYPLLAFVVFIHAYRHGGRLNICWNAQGLLTFFGSRIPLSTVFGANQVFLYIAYVFVQRMYLPLWAQATATGLAVILLKLPYLIIGTKYLWWTWQSGGNADPIYRIPWIVLFFDAFFAQSFVYILQIARSVMLYETYDWKKFFREFCCAFSAGVLSFWLSLAVLSALSAVSQLCQISVGSIVCLLFSLFVIAVYIVDRRNPTLDAHSGNAYWFDELSLAACVHFIFIIILSLVVSPSNIVSVGLHQPLGTYEDRHLSGSHSSYYDFHCLPGGKMENYEYGLEWYAVCGTPFHNRTEYSIVLSAYCLLASIILYQAAAASGKTPHVYQLVYGSTLERKKTK
uniref:DUF7802 domain-containing protein n=1 Tax=Globodera rostochiensis TaxID=31243 RepID=A0A914H1F8_GLORO